MIKKLLLLFCAIWCLSSCMQKTDVDISDKEQIKFNAEIEMSVEVIPELAEQTKSLASVEEKKAFVKGDRIAMVLSPNKDESNTDESDKDEPYSTPTSILEFDGQEWNLVSGDNEIVPMFSWQDIGTFSANFVSVYPIPGKQKEGAWGAAIREIDHKVATDQSSREKHEKSDLLYTGKTPGSNGNPVPLNFKHAMSKIEVILKPGDTGLTPEQLSDATISIQAKNGSLVNPFTGEISLKSDAADEQITFLNAGNGHYRAVLSPQPVLPAWETKWLTIKVAGKTLWNQAPKFLDAGKKVPFDKLESGKQLTLTLNLNKTATFNLESVILSDNGLNTRAPQLDDNGAGQFLDGDHNLLLFQNAGKVLKSFDYEYGKKYFWGGFQLPENVSECTISAAYPKVNPEKSDAFKWDVTKNHEDFLFAKPVTAKVNSASPVQLNFKHALHKLVVNVQNETQSVKAGEAETVKVSLQNFCPVAIFNLMTAEVVGSEGNLVNMDMSLVSKQNTTQATLLVPSQVIGTMEIVIQVGDRQGVLKLSDCTIDGKPVEKLESGLSFTSNIKVTDRSFEIVGEQISGWGNQGEYQGTITL